MFRSLFRRSVKDLVVASLCVAIAIILPVLLHGIPNAGSVLLPMHLPVLLCGLLCGPGLGLLCGVCAPLLSSLLTGMPGAAFLPAMLCELAAYGFFSGMMIRLLHTRHRLCNLYLSLLSAMLLGRVCYGVLNAVVFHAGQYSLSLWLTASFVTALPGIFVQLLVLPPLVLALQKSRLVS